MTAFIRNLTILLLLASLCIGGHSQCYTLSTYGIYYVCFSVKSFHKNFSHTYLGLFST